MGWRKNRTEVEESTDTGNEVLEDEMTPQSQVDESPSIIGASTEVEGEFAGSQDVIVHGTVRGTVWLPGYNLEIAVNGHVHAEVRAETVTVAGEVVGDITADGRVEVTSTGSMVGDIRAGRVVLAEGARFRGRIDMGPEDAADETEPQAETWVDLDDPDDAKEVEAAVSVVDCADETES